MSAKFSEQIGYKEWERTVTEYLIMGRLNGHNVYYCSSMGAPKVWSRGCGWAIVRSDIRDIKKFYKEAVKIGGAKNIRIIRVVSEIYTKEYIEEL